MRMGLGSLAITDILSDGVLYRSIKSVSVVASEGQSVDNPPSLRRDSLNRYRKFSVYVASNRREK